MLKIEKTEVSGWEVAIRGMRNPLNSWEKSDTIYLSLGYCDEIEELELAKMCGGVAPIIKKNDLKLMKTLAKAGADHGKFLRMINVTCDITAPLYWWKEFDTYKVGTVANSCSTMHKIHAKEFTLDDFSIEHLDYIGESFIIGLVGHLNYIREDYNNTKSKNKWWQMIQLLPTSYNQKRTVQLNYQVLKSMYFSRRNHKLDEWHILCNWAKSLPYFEEICIQESDN